MSTTPRYTFPTDDELRGRRVLVMGLGLFGGGAAAVRFLVDRGARVRVTDLRDEAALAETLEDLEGVPFERVLGEHREADFAAAEFIVVNPAVPAARSPHLALAARRGVPFTSEVGLTLSRLRAPLILVTGSKGKTTTSTLLHRMLRAGGADAVLGGNVGVSLLERADALTPRQPVVFEISSFQLEQIRGLSRRPALTLITNLFPVHLDRHGTFEAYRDLKWSAVEGAAEVVLDHSDDELRRLGATLGDAVTWFAAGDPPPRGYQRRGTEVVEVSGGGARLDLSGLRVPGVHNLDNATAAFAAARRLGVAEAACGEAIQGFDGVPHRLEPLPSVAGVRFVNDSIATTPRATSAALGALDGPILLLMGGQLEGEVPLGDLPSLAAERCRLVVAFGAGGSELAARLESAGGSGLAVERARGLAEAVQIARRRAREGDTVLLSPGLPSFDEFRNFQERGDAFRRLAVGRPEGLYAP